MAALSYHGASPNRSYGKFCTLHCSMLWTCVANFGASHGASPSPLGSSPPFLGLSPILHANALLLDLLCCGHGVLWHLPYLLHPLPCLPMINHLLSNCTTLLWLLELCTIGLHTHCAHIHLTHHTATMLPVCHTHPYYLHAYSHPPLRTCCSRPYRWH